MIKKEKYIYQCTDCGREYSGKETIYLCPSCSAAPVAGTPPRGVLKTIYNYEELRRTVPGFKGLKDEGFISLLPIESLESLPPLRIGNTPLCRTSSGDGRKLPYNLFLKDDSQNPTWSFKDRASALVSAYAVERGLGTIVTASTGNAGSSLAGICASRQQRAVIMVPEKAPQAKLTQIVMYGATLVPVRGTYDDAFDLSIKASDHFGWYNRNTAYNPLTIEGKKTVSFELFEQMGFHVPDNIFVPAGDGVIMSGVYKGFEDLLRLNIIDHIPVIVAVQSELSDNLVRNIQSEAFRVINSTTVADSISVDIPRNFYMAQHFIREYGGKTLTVTDEEILKASAALAAGTGIFAEPAAAAAYAGFLAYQRNDLVPALSNNIVLLTGSGLKDTASIRSLVRMPEPIIPTLDNLAEAVK
jgi:threonine synthase